MLSQIIRKWKIHLCLSSNFYNSECFCWSWILYPNFPDVLGLGWATKFLSLDYFTCICFEISVLIYIFYDATHVWLTNLQMVTVATDDYHCFCCSLGLVFMICRFLLFISNLFESIYFFKVDTNPRNFSNQVRKLEISFLKTKMEMFHKNWRRSMV